VDLPIKSSQKIIATNWSYEPKTQAFRSAWVVLTAASNSSLENSLRIWLNMEHDLFTGGPPLYVLSKWVNLHVT